MATSAGYTTVENIAGMFPLWVRGSAQQKPSDALVIQFALDVQGELDAILAHRFASAIGGQSVPQYVNQLGQDALNTLEKINRYGAAAQLGDTLATFGVAAARELGKSFRETYLEMLNELDARDANGRKRDSGRYDKQFDSLARTETPRPGFTGIAGGDQPSTQKPADLGQSNQFGKFDPRGT